MSDFIEMIDIPELSACIATIKRGHYSFLDVHAKLGILRELVFQALSTDLFREKLDVNIEQRQALAATRREEALEEGRRKRGETEWPRVEPDSFVQTMDSIRSNSSENNNHKQNGDVEKRIQTKLPSGQKHALGKRFELSFPFEFICFQ